MARAVATPAAEWRAQSERRGVLPVTTGLRPVIDLESAGRRGERPRDLRLDDERGLVGLDLHEWRAVCDRVALALELGEHDCALHVRSELG